MRSRIVQCHGEAQRNSWGGVSEIVDREAGHSRRRAAAVRCGGAVAMSTLPILDYGAPAEGAGAGGDGEHDAVLGLSRTYAVPTDGGGVRARWSAIVPPEGARPRVPGAVPVAIGVVFMRRREARMGGNSSPAGAGSDDVPGDDQEAPPPSIRLAPPRTPSPATAKNETAKKRTTWLPAPGASVATSKNTESRRAAETAIARVRR